MDTENAPTTPASGRKWFTHSRWFTCLLVLSAGCLIAYAGVRYYLDYPRFIILTVPAPNNPWAYTEEVVVTWPVDHDAKFYVWRGKAAAFGPQYSDWDAVVRYFDDALEREQWQRDGSTKRTACEDYLLRTDLLKQIDGHSVAYRPVGSDNRFTTPVVCLAGWPTTYGSGFYIVLATVNPSPLVEFQRKFVDD